MCSLRSLFTTLLSIGCLSSLLLGCNEKKKDVLTVVGKLTNAEDQQIFLEEIYFSGKAPEILDTSLMQQGQFQLNTPLVKPGLYRIRLEKSTRGFLLINDQPTIRFTGDLLDMRLDGPRFYSRANEQFRRFMIDVDQHRKQLDSLARLVEQLQNPGAGTDSSRTVAQNKWKKSDSTYQQFLLNYLDTVYHPVLAMITVGFTGNMEPLPLEPVIQRLEKRFADNETILSMAAQYREELAKYQAKPRAGVMAPEISLPDTSGNTVTLSSLRGKYVLVDFWASWCAPCREENPNVVKAYQLFNTKNFTVLGVSLDKERAGWTQAIRADKLSWPQVSDLKFWSGETIKKYGVEAIPYNVLVDPTGKIVAINLRGPKLIETLRNTLGTSPNK